MTGIQSHIDARAEQVAKIGAWEDSAERCKFWCTRLNRHDTLLIVAFVICEEEDSIAAYRAAHLITELGSLELRVRIGGVALQSGVSGQIVVPIKIEPAAVIVVAARASDDVDRAVGRRARGHIEVDCRDLEFLNHLL